MRAQRATAHTQMSVAECAHTFQAAVSQARGLRSQMGGLVSKMTGSDQSGFFTPSSDGPFAGLDNDEPDFAVGCNIPKLTNSSRGAALTVHMYVWDRQAHRELEFVSPHGMIGGGSSSKLVGKVVRSFVHADPSLEVTSHP